MIPFIYRPESPLLETLESLTSVLLHKDGTEQRQALRIAPRQKFSANYLLDEETERPQVEAILYGAQEQIFSIPLWAQGSQLSQAEAAAVTTLHLDTTLGDFRVGDVILIDSGLTEMVTAIATVASDHITLSAATTLAWRKGTEVYPMRPALLLGAVRSSRTPLGLASYSLDFAVTQNDVNLGTGSLAYSAVGVGDDTTLLVVPDANRIDSAVQESSDRGVILIDNTTGVFQNLSYWLASRRGSARAWNTTNRTTLQHVRGLLHYLNGQLQSFLAPTFAHDLTPAANLVSAATTLDVANIGLTGYSAVGLNPRKYIRVEAVDGTSQTRQVSSVSVISGTVERLVVSTAWSASVTLANIARITFLEKVRLNNDTVQIQHTDLIGTAQIDATTTAVLEAG